MGRDRECEMLETDRPRHDFSVRVFSQGDGDLGVFLGVYSSFYIGLVDNRFYIDIFYRFDYSGHTACFELNDGLRRAFLSPKIDRQNEGYKGYWD